MLRPEQREREKKLTKEEALRAMPKTSQGVKVKFRKEKKEDKLKKLLGDKYMGVIIKGDEVELLVDVDDLSSSDKEKIQKIWDGE